MSTARRDSTEPKILKEIETKRMMEADSEAVRNFVCALSEACIEVNEPDIEFYLCKICQLVDRGADIAATEELADTLFTVIANATVLQTAQYACSLLSRVADLFDLEMIVSKANPAIIDVLVQRIHSSEGVIHRFAQALATLAKMDSSCRDRIIEVLPFEQIFELLREDWDQDSFVYSLVLSCCWHRIPDDQAAFVVTNLLERLDPGMPCEVLSSILETLAILMNSAAAMEALGAANGPQLCLSVIESFKPQLQNANATTEASICSSVLRICDFVFQTHHTLILPPPLLTSLITTKHQHLASLSLRICTSMLTFNQEQHVEWLRAGGIIHYICKNIRFGTWKTKNSSLALLCQYLEFADASDYNSLVCNTPLRALLDMCGYGDDSVTLHVLHIIHRVWNFGIETGWTAASDPSLMLDDLELLCDSENEEVAELAKVVHQEMLEHSQDD